MNKAIEKILSSEIDPAFKLRAEAIFSAIEEVKPKTVLETGCGRGFYVHALTKYEFIDSINGIDVKKEYLAKAHKFAQDPRVNLNVASIYDLPYEDASVDVVICSEVLEHLSDEHKALQEIRRVLKQDGVFLASVPCADYPFFWDPFNKFFEMFLGTHANKNHWWLAGIWADHERLYTLGEFEELISSHGFSIARKESFIQHAWPFSHFFLYGIGKNFVAFFNFKAGNRFSDNNGSAFVSALARFISLPSRTFDIQQKHDVAVDLFIEAVKDL